MNKHSTATSDPIHAGKPPKKPRTQIALRVLRKETLSPHMVRIVAGGSDLEKFVPKDATDMYVKIHFLNPAVEYSEPIDVFELRKTLPREHQPVTRTYTVRWVDLPARELAIDFVLHGDSGLAGPWAALAKPGDQLRLSGPGGAYFPNPDADWYLFVADESAIPAVAAALEILPPDSRGHAYIEVDTSADIQQLAAPAGIEMHWVLRDGPESEANTVLTDTVNKGPWLEGYVDAFVHGEREQMKALRDLLFKQKGLSRSQVSLSGYWARGRSEDKFQAEKREPIGQIL